MAEIREPSIKFPTFDGKKSNWNRFEEDLLATFAALKKCAANLATLDSASCYALPIS